ncbi:MAG: NB-ARC domain-containing protein [Pseudomonadota bacterium]
MFLEHNIGFAHFYRRIDDALTLRAKAIADRKGEKDLESQKELCRVRYQKAVHAVTKSFIRLRFPEEQEDTVWANRLRPWLKDADRQFAKDWDKIQIGSGKSPLENLRTGEGRIIRAYAIHYRLHGEFSDKSFAQQIDSTVFRASAANLRFDRPVFKEPSNLQASFPQFIQLGSNYQRGRAEFKATKAAVLNNEKQITAIYGAPGYGKTAIAEELCLDREVIEHFPGGIYWLQFSINIDHESQQSSGGIRQTPSAISKMLRTQNYDREKTDRLGIDNIERLLEALPKERLLIIADDAWNETEFHWQDTLSAHASCLITTRNQRLARNSDKDCRIVAELTEEVSYQVLVSLTDGVSPEQETRLRKVARKFNGWPLIIKLAASFLRDRSQRKKHNVDVAITLLEELVRNKAFAVLEEPDHSGYPAHMARREQIRLCIEAGLNLISSKYHPSLFYSLGIFPDDTDIPISVVADFWVYLSKFEPSLGIHNGSYARSLLDRFDQFSLFRDYDGINKTLRLHDEVLHVLRQQLQTRGILQQRHEELVDCFKEKCPNGWHSVPKREQYIWKHLLFHMMNADLPKQAKALCGDLRWLHNKLYAAGATELSSSFTYISDSHDGFASKAKRAVRASMPALLRRPTSFGHQMFGRLAHQTNDAYLNSLRLISCGTENVAFAFSSPHLNPLNNVVFSDSTGGVFIEGLSFSCSGDTFYIARENGSISVIDSFSGEIIKKIDHSDGGVALLKVFSTPNFIVTVSDSIVKIWKIETFELYHEICIPNKKLIINACLIDYNQIALVDEFSNLHIYEISESHWVKGAFSNPLVQHGIRFIDCSNNVCCIVNHIGCLSIFDIQNNQFQYVQSFTRRSINAAVVSKCGTKIGIGTYDGVIAVYSSDKAILLSQTEKIHQGGVCDLDFSADCRSIYSVGRDRNVIRTTLDEVKPLSDRVGKSYHSLNFLGVSPINENIVAASSLGTYLAVDPTVGAGLTDSRINLSDRVEEIVVSADGLIFALTAYCGIVVLEDKNCDLVFKYVIDDDNIVSSFAISEDGEYLFYGTKNGELYSYKIDSRVIKKILQNTDQISFIIAPPSSGRIFVGDRAGRLILLNSSDWTIHQNLYLYDVIPEIEEIHSQINCGFYSTYMESLFIGTLSGFVVRIKIINNNFKFDVLLKKPEPPSHAYFFRNRITDIAVEEDGCFIVVADGGGSVEKFQNAYGVLSSPQRFSHSWFCASIALSPCRKFLASGSLDKTVIILRMADMSVLINLDFDSGVRKVAWNGTRIIVGLEDGSISIIKVIFS